MIGPMVVSKDSPSPCAATFAARTDFERIMCTSLSVPDSGEYDSACLLKPDVSGRMTQIWQVIVDTTQRILFPEIKHAITVGV